MPSRKYVCCIVERCQMALSSKMIVMIISCASVHVVKENEFIRLKLCYYFWLMKIFDCAVERTTTSKYVKRLHHFLSIFLLFSFLFIVNLEEIFSIKLQLLNHFYRCCNSISSTFLSLSLVIFVSLVVAVEMHQRKTTEMFIVHAVQSIVNIEECVCAHACVRSRFACISVYVLYRARKYLTFTGVSICIL